jgi:hypothetical protein
VITGNGYADIIPTSRNITLSGLTEYPKPGTQVILSDRDKIYTTVLITPLGQITNDGTLSAYLQISPYLSIGTYNSVYHHQSVALRNKYSQGRITGHDFLDIGTGNYVNTNYPKLYNGNFFSAPEQQVVEALGGRVFYTSTDQNGNFRTGSLFAVEQASGIVTLSADFFNFSGLSELRLGGIRFGANVIITEFSTDVLFTADSNNIIPTQRAIKAYLASKLSVAGADLVATAFTAGQQTVGNLPATWSSANTVFVTRPTNWQGNYAAVRGTIVAQTYFFRSFQQNDY